MISNEKTIMIQRPVEEVFAYISDLENGLQWQPGLLEVKRLNNGSLGVGTKFSSLRKFLGLKMETSVEFIVFEPNKKIVFRSIPGTMPLETTHLFESTAGGTRFTTKIEMQPSGFMSLAEPLMASSLRKTMDSQFDGLKVLLENREKVIPSSSQA